MLSCLVPRFGQEDKINNIMPSSSAFAMQFPSLASGLPKDDESLTPHAEYFLKCNQCHQSFLEFQALKDHLNTVHSTEKPQQQYNNNNNNNINNNNNVNNNNNHQLNSLLCTPSPPLINNNINNNNHHPHHLSNFNLQNNQLTLSASSLASTSTTDECGRSTSPNTSTVGGPHACSQCSASFPNRDLLEKHELLHSPNSTVSCKICHKTFANVYRLQRHMISHDESALLRKFKCTDCDKAFKFKHHLKEHVRIHSGEKPFACNNCGKRFSHSGSYSSHMTSKKCISMGLKLNNGRILKTSNDKTNNRLKEELLYSATKRNNFLQSNLPPGLNNLNNNNTTNNPNHNNFLSILPKCTSYDAMNAAALFATMPNPFFPMPFDPRNTFPYNLQRFIELTAATNGGPQHNAMENLLKSTQFNNNKTPSLHSDPEDMIEEVTEDLNDEPKLVMDLGDDEKSEHEEERKLQIAQQSSPRPAIPENHNNYSIDSSSFSRTEDIKSESSLNLHEQSQSPHRNDDDNIKEEIKEEEDINKEDILQCSHCDKIFNHQTELVQHEKVLCGIYRKHEGLAAQMAESIALSTASYLSMASGSDDEDRDSKMLSEGERKVRVRTAISEEQQQVLKDHYAANPRPNRDEFRTIAQRLMLDPRVVQVWFQNNRSRERKLNNISYKKDFSIHHPMFLGHSTSPSLSSPIDLDQPLDLSLKKESATSTPSSSPRYGTVPQQSDSSITDEVMNLSLKSESRGVTPYRLFNYGVSLTNGSSESQTPSPSQAHTPYSYMMPNQTLGLVSMERLLQMTPDLPRNPLLGFKSERDSSLSPGSEKRAWKDENSRLMIDSDTNHFFQQQPHHYHNNHHQQHLTKRMNTQKEQEAEGQFVCDQCEKAFSKQSSLARHKYEHSGQRPYKCAECPKAFKHKHHLTEHKRLHSGEKPFQCSKCLKRFSHSGSYSQHMNHRYSYCKPYRE